MSKQVGMVGLGQFGLPMAKLLVDGGYPVVGYDISPEARRKAGDAGITIAETPAALAGHCDQIVLSLPTSNEVEQACFGRDGLAQAARKGLTIIDTTSGSAAKTLEIGARLAEQGVDFVDAGVSGVGGSSAVETGLTVMVGASPELFQRCRPILETIGRCVHLVGPPGSGHVAKMLNNMLLGVGMLATAEAVAAGIKAGLDPKALVSVMQLSSGRNFWTEHRFPEFVLKGDFSARSGGRLALLEKDMAQAMELGRKNGVPMAVGANAHQMIRLIMAEIGPDVPSTRAVQRFEEWAGFSFHTREG